VACHLPTVRRCRSGYAGGIHPCAANGVGVGTFAASRGGSNARRDLAATVANRWLPAPETPSPVVMQDDAEPFTGEANILNAGMVIRDLHAAPVQYPELTRRRFRQR
jgi:hypothetical protein